MNVHIVGTTVHCKSTCKSNFCQWLLIPWPIAEWICPTPWVLLQSSPDSLADLITEFWYALSVIDQVNNKLLFYFNNTELRYKQFKNTSRNSKTIWLLSLPDLSPKIHVLSIGPFEVQSDLSQKVHHESM